VQASGIDGNAQTGKPCTFSRWQQIKMTNEMKDVLTFNEAAEYTGLSKSYLYKLTSAQRIPFYKPMGKCLFFNRLELEAFLQQNRVNTVDEISSQAMTYCMSKRKGGKK
jgi:excisionase family DNA binding protein